MDDEMMVVTDSGSRHLDRERTVMPAFDQEGKGFPNACSEQDYARGKTQKIVVLMGSPRKGNTFRACEEFRENLQEIFPAEFEYIWLKDAHIEPCKGCFICFPKGEDKCPSRNDDIAAIVQKMLDADGVIFASPVYSWNVSALMKTFIDRISYTGHRPRFAGKKAFFLVTTGMMGANDVLKYMKKVAWAWGFECTGMVGLITPNGIVPRYRAEMNTKLLRKAAKQFSAGLRRKQKGPGILDIMLFHGGKGAMSQLETLSPADYQYWKSRGWLSPDAQYFMDFPVNPLYRSIGKIVEMIAKRHVRKDVILISGSTNECTRQVSGDTA